MCNLITILLPTILLCRHVQTRTSSDIIFVTHSYVTNTYKPRRNHKSQPLLNGLGHAENSPVAGFVAVPRYRHDWLWLCQWGPHSSSAAKDDVIGHFRFQQGCLNIGTHKSDWFIAAFLIQVATLEYQNTNPDVFQLHQRCTLKKHQLRMIQFRAVSQCRIVLIHSSCFIRIQSSPISSWLPCIPKPIHILDWNIMKDPLLVLRPTGCLISGAMCNHSTSPAPSNLRRLGPLVTPGFSWSGYLLSTVSLLILWLRFAIAVFFSMATRHRWRLVFFFLDLLLEGSPNCKYDLCFVSICFLELCVLCCNVYFTKQLHNFEVWSHFWPWTDPRWGPVLLFCVEAQRANASVFDVMFQ